MKFMTTMMSNGAFKIGASSTQSSRRCYAPLGLSQKDEVKNMEQSQHKKNSVEVEY